jgi:hypothetical protein
LGFEKNFEGYDKLKLGLRLLESNPRIYDEMKSFQARFIYRDIIQSTASLRNTIPKDGQFIGKDRISINGEILQDNIDDQVICKILSHPVEFWLEYISAYNVPHKSKTGMINFAIKYINHKDAAFSPQIKERIISDLESLLSKM